MPRKIQATYQRGLGKTLAAMGDSLSYNVTLGVRPDQFWPKRLADALRALGCGVRSRNFGRSGNTTTDMIARFGAMTAYDVPFLGAIWGGVNDPGNGISGATTQANIQQMAEALFAAGTPYVLIGNTQYLNYSTNVETVGVPYSTYATLRTSQKAAADALIPAYPGRVAYVDIYAAFRQEIVGGAVAQGDWAAWHVADLNQHLNPAGEQVVADAMVAAIQARPDWLDALRTG